MGMVTEFGKWWLESLGRRKQTSRYTFSETEVVSAPYPKTVSSMWKALYLNLHPTHYGVAIAPNGKIIILKGGYNSPLSPGRYIIHYIDRQNRVNHLPRITEITCDGFQVTLELVITYRVTDPIKALEVQNAVETLLGFIQSDVKEFIRSHKYDDLVGDLAGHKVENEQIARYIKDQHATRHQMARLFFVEDVVINDKKGDPKINEIREAYHINQRQYATQIELQNQNQELEKKVTEQETLIKQMKVDAEAKLQEKLHEMERQKIELENERTELQLRQDQWMRAMDAIGQAFSSPAFPRDPQVLDVIRQLLNSMGVTTATAPAPEAASPEEQRPAPEPAPTANTQEMDSLTNTLLGLLSRKKF